MRSLLALVATGDVKHGSSISGRCPQSANSNTSSLSSLAGGSGLLVGGEDATIV